MLPIRYVLTTFSPSMFEEKATCHLRIIGHPEAAGLISEKTKIVATRAGHERLARSLFPGVCDETGRYATLKPGFNAIHIHYRGAPVPDSGEIPAGGTVTYYLIETEEYQEHE